MNSKGFYLRSFLREHLAPQLRRIAAEGQNEGVENDTPSQRNPEKSGCSHTYI